MRVLSTRGRGARAAQDFLSRLLTGSEASYERALPAAQRIVQGVRRGGDAALLRYRAKFDGIAASDPLRITAEEMEAAWKATSAELKAALKLAAKNIRRFAQKQRPRDFTLQMAPGVTAGQKVIPLEAVGCYVPSGRYPLPSTLLMTAIPAQVAGVRRIVAVSPRPAKETLAAAHLLGITEFYRIGGAQAVAALAYGTASIERVDKIVGPGNAYVTAAKKAVSFDCGIDMLAGPTEIVVASENGTVEGIAADLIAQAEHDPDAIAILVTSNAELGRAVAAETKLHAKSNAIAKQSIAANGAVILTRDVEEARMLTNRLAAEHLTVDSSADLAWVRHAGSVFVGRWSSQPLGDYVSGPNHTLPTSGLARLRGGLSVMDYLKLVTVQEYSAAGVRQLGPSAVALAEAEGLVGHADAVRVRLQSAKPVRRRA
uniref:Histidinol dehydrogenase n=1 Tax=Acidobacterium capsulatum TaxID=33075 RepID=A0A7V5CTD7_9BACT